MSTGSQQVELPETCIELDVIQTIERLCAVYGAYSWGVRCGEDDVLILDFGCPRLYVRELVPTSQFMANRRLVSPTGQWNLWVFDGNWEIEAGGLSLSRKHLEKGLAETQIKCLSHLNGQKLISVDWQSDLGLWVFTFDLGGKLSVSKDNTKPADGDGGSEWTMFFADSGSLSCVADDKCLWERPSA